MLIQPRHQCRADIKTHELVVIHQIHEVATIVKNSGESIRAITLVGDAFVPVVKGGGAGLSLDRIEVGIFARGLVEMTVNRDVGLRRAGLARCTRRAGCVLGRRRGAGGMGSGVEIGGG